MPVTGGWEMRRWTTEDGLPQNSVNAITQGPEGYLWFGTFGGLVRFDGRRFRKDFVTEAGGLAGQRILSLAFDQKGVLWVGTEEQGLFRLVDGKLTAVSHPDGGGWGNVWSILVDDDGSVLVGGRGLVRFRGGEAEARYPIEGAPDANVRDLFLRSDGSLWVVTDQALAVRDADGQFEVVYPSGGWLVGEDLSGRMFLNSSSSFLLRKESGFELVDSVEKNFAHDRLTDRRGRMWIGGRALHEVLPGADFELEQVVSRSVLGGGVRAIYEDREENLWVGIDGGGLICLSESRKTELRLQLDDESSVLHVTGADRDALWIGSTGNKPYLLREGELQEPGFDPPSPIASMSADAAGTLWLGTEGALHSWDGSELTEHPYEGIRLQLHTQSGSAWLASLEALYHLEHGELVETYHFPKGWLRPSSMTPAPQGGVWLITPRQLALASHGELSTVATEGDWPDAPLRAVHADDRGTLWITTYGSGLVRWNGTDVTVYRATDGLHDDALGGIFGDGHGLWINSNRGVFHLIKSELESFAAGDLAEVSSRVLSSAEGNGSGATRTSDGSMWFPTIHGIVGVSPDVRFNEMVPSVAIEGVTIDGAEVPFERAPVSLPTHAGRIDIAYSAVSLTAPERCSVRYRLLPHDLEWRDGSSRRVATYSGLESGQYEFQVIASNSDGVWNLEGKTLEVAVEPHFSETLVFRALIAAILGLVAFGVHRWRLAGRLLFMEKKQRGLVEAALRASEDSLRVMAETANDGIVTIDDSSRIQYVNRAGARIFGLFPTQCIGEPITRFIRRGEKNGHLDALAEFIRTGRKSIPWEGLLLNVCRADGSEVPVEISLGEYEGPDGHRVFTAILRDVTERKRLEQRLADARKMEALGRLAGGVAHDFNNIITALMGNVDIARARLDDRDYVSECLKEIRECSDRAASLTKQMLAFSRRQMNRPEVLRPDETLAQLRTLLRRLIPENIEIVYDLRAPEARIKADPSQIEQIVINLAANARDAMPDGGELRVASTVVHVESDEVHEDDVPQGTWVRITVADSGGGISEKDLPHVFEPFFTTKPVGKGTGLGLASVHGIIQQAGGHIRVESEPGAGTRFRVYLQLVGEGLVLIPAVKPDPPRPEGRANVLVCDDFSSVLDVVRATLLGDGHSVLVAKFPREAVELARSNPVDVLVTDVVMPQMNGGELAATIREIHPSVRVLYVTGYVDSHIPRGEDGMDDLLPKPFTATELRNRVRTLLEREPDAGKLRG